MVSFKERIEILYLYKAHGMSAGDIARILDKSYSTIRSLMITFDKHGRINKLLTHSAKKVILEGRAHRATLLKNKHPNNCASSMNLTTFVNDEGKEKLTITDNNIIISNSTMKA